MNIRLLFIGKTDERWLSEAIEKYAGRLRNYLPFSIDIIPDLKNTKAMTTVRQKEEEGRLILKNTGKSEQVILLDEHGREFSSKEFSGFLQKKMNSGIKTLTFVVGGPYGFSDEIYAQFSQKVSLSKMTFSHQMIRLLITEQIYRAMTILRNEPYHHE